MFKKIQAALAAEFIREAEVARVLSLAVVAGKNVLLWGPA